MKYNLKSDYQQLVAMYPGLEQYLNLEYLQSLEDGRLDISPQTYLLKTTYKMRKADELFFEAHRKYIDIHIILKGSELFALNDIENLTVTTEYNENDDAIIYDRSGPIKKYVRCELGELVIFDFQDGHMTAIGDEKEEVTKVIIKVQK